MSNTQPDFKSPAEVIAEEDKDLVLNQGQEQVAQSFFQFMLSNDKEFSISGPAGTGKTTLMRHIIGVTMPEAAKAAALLGGNQIDYEVILTATTNKAAEVLADVTGFPTSTIHSHMNLKVQDDYKTGVSKVIRTANFVVHSKQVIFIDEASMADTPLIEHLIEGTDSSCKIVYLGDHCQMAPVFEAISPVYKNPKNVGFLIHPMRNAGAPALMSLCTQLRHTVETKEFHPIREVPGVIDYLDPDQAYEFMESTFSEENPNCRVLAYSNARVKEYLDLIRDLRGYPDLFTEGEHVLNNTGMQLPGKLGTLRVEEEMEIIEVTQEPHVITINHCPDGNEIEIYGVRVKSARRPEPLNLFIPSQPTHFREMTNYYKRMKNWKAFYYLKNTFPDLRQRDAATVYKAQGSTYESVFMDLTNIGSATNVDQLSRMLYVGASRASKRLFLFGQLPQRLFVK